MSFYLVLKPNIWAINILVFVCKKRSLYSKIVPYIFYLVPLHSVHISDCDAENKVRLSNLFSSESTLMCCEVIVLLLTNNQSCLATWKTLLAILFRSEKSSHLKTQSIWSSIWTKILRHLEIVLNFEIYLF